jgi:hypothetical protein
MYFGKWVQKIRKNVIFAQMAEMKQKRIKVRFGVF